MRGSVGHRKAGYAMAGLLLMMAVMAVVLSVAMPVWRTVVQREKEEELIFRGRQYARAIQLYQRKFANAYPASVDVLVEQRFLRKKYTDPMTKSGEFEIIYQATLAQQRAAAAGRGSTTPGAPSGTAPGGTTAPPLAMPGSAFASQAAGPRGGVVGVASRSKEKSIRVLDGRSAYNEWQFIWAPAPASRGGQAGSIGPGGRGGRPGASTPGTQPGRGPGGAGSPFTRPPGR